MLKPEAATRPKVLIAMEPVTGGTLRHLELILRHTSDREFELHLAVSPWRDPAARGWFRRWREAGWTVHEVPMRRQIAPWRDVAAFRRLRALCRRERFDVVHTHCAKAGFLGRLAARLAGAWTIHTPHVFPFGRGGGSAQEWLYLSLERHAARWTDRLVLLGRYQANQCAWHRLVPPDRVAIVPNGVDPDDFVPADKAAARAELGLSGAGLLALWAGRLTEQKGLEVLVEAACRLSAERPCPARIVAVGSGPLEGWLRRQVEMLGLGSVLLLRGHTDRMPAYYAACDLLVLTSRYEGMPYCLLEAKAAGRPAAVNLVSGMEEFVTHGRDGFLLPPGNSEALAELLKNLSDRREVLEQMGAQARQSLRPEWTARCAVRRLHELYWEGAEKRRTQRLPSSVVGR